ncbi:MAG: hypothetical protein FWG10_14450, partial [Eubacteriaceae bacterium]|nr:hypothetical protein [Eubacteriaceae bacterium]
IFIIPLTILSDDEIIYYLAPLCKLGFFFFAAAMLLFHCPIVALLPNRCMLKYGRLWHREPVIYLLFGYDVA